MSQAPTKARRSAAFWFYAFHLWTVTGIALSNFMGAFALAGTYSTLRGHRVPWRRFLPLLAPLGSYLVLVVFSTVNASQPNFGELGQLLGLSTLVLGLLLVREESDARRIVDGLEFVAMLIAIYGLSQLVEGFGGLEQRIRGPFSHPLTFAGLLVLADVLLLAQLLCGRFRTWKLAATALITLAIAISLCRGAWVALLVAATTLLWLRARRWLLAGLPVALMVLLAAPSPVRDRVASILDPGSDTSFGRLLMFDAGLHMLRERPLFGHGLGFVEEHYDRYGLLDGSRTGVEHLHNSYLQVAAEEGLLALVALMWLFWSAAAAAVRSYRSCPHQRDLHLGVLLSLLAFAVFALSEDSWHDTEIQRIVLFLVALPICLAKDSEEDC